MKIDEASLQHIMKAYGIKSGKPKNTNAEEAEDKKDTADIKDKPKKSDKQDAKSTIFGELGLINYDEKGHLQIDPEKKKKLVDFFQ